MKNNPEIQDISQIVSEEATDCFINYNVEFEFHDLDGDVQTVFVKEHRSSANPVEFFMLKTLEKRIQKINPRYRVGILYTEESEEEREFNEFRL